MPHRGCGVKLYQTGVQCTQDLTFTCFRTILADLEETIETQNITLSLPQEILLKVKQPAVKRQTSVSGLLAQTPERMVHQDSDAGNLTCVNCGFPMSISMTRACMNSGI